MTKGQVCFLLFMFGLSGIANFVPYEEQFECISIIVAICSFVYVFDFDKWRPRW